MNRYRQAALRQAAANMGPGERSYCSFADGSPGFVIDTPGNAAHADTVGTIPIDEFRAPAVDLEAAFRSIWCLPHRFMVLVPPKDEQRGGFFLPSKSQKLERLPIGVVIAAGRESGLLVGDHAIVVSKFAKVVKGLSVGGFSTDGEIWMFGTTSPHVRECRLVAPRHTALAVVGHTDFDTATASFKQRSCEPCPYRAHDIRMHPRLGSGEGRVVLELAAKSSKWANSLGGPDLELPDALADRPDVATVVSASPQCRSVVTGDQVLYLRRGLECLYPDAGKRYAICPEKALYAVVQE